MSYVTEPALVTVAAWDELPAGRRSPAAGAARHARRAAPVSTAAARSSLMPTAANSARGRSSGRCGRPHEDCAHGLASGFQDPRYYLASLLIALGADVETVQARLRHASAKTTLDTYGAPVAGRDESTRAAVEAAFAARAEQGRNRAGAL